MEQKLDCEIVQDLLPNYIEHMTSEGTNKSIAKHLEECPKCREVYRQMTQEVKAVSNFEVKEVKSYLNKIKLMYAVHGLGILCLLAVIICFIVNLALEQTISWAWIPTGAIIYFCAGLYVFSLSRKNRWIRLLLSFSVLLLPLLWIIQMTSYYLMEIGTFWLWPQGILNALMWLAIIWSSVLSRVVLKWNVFFGLAVLCILSVPGSCISNTMENNGVLDPLLLFSQVWGSAVAGGVFLFLGIWHHKRKQ